MTSNYVLPFNISELYTAYTANVTPFIDSTLKSKEIGNGVTYNKKDSLLSCKQGDTRYVRISEDDLGQSLYYTLEGCESNGAVLIAPERQVITYAVIKYGRWIDNICNGTSGVPPRYQIYKIVEAIGRKSHTIAGGTYDAVFGNPYSGIAKHWLITYYVSGPNIPVYRDLRTNVINSQCIPSWCAQVVNLSRINAPNPIIYNQALVQAINIVYTPIDGAIYVTVAGWYMLFFYAFSDITYSGFNVPVEVKLYKNGFPSTNPTCRNYTECLAQYRCGLDIITPIYLNTGDNVQIWVTIGSLHGNLNCVFSAYRMGN